MRFKSRDEGSNACQRRGRGSCVPGFAELGLEHGEEQVDDEIGSEEDHKDEVRHHHLGPDARCC